MSIPHKILLQHMKKTTRFYSQFILGALVAFTLALPINSSANETDAILEPAGIVDKIRKQISKISVSSQVNIVEAEIYEGLSTALSYRIESEPSYIDGYYTRLDKYRLRVKLNPGDLIDDDDTPFGFDIRKDVEVIFARQFKSQKQSYLSFPYTFKNFPLTAARATKNLNVGDFVAFQTNLSLVLSVGTFPELGGTVDVGLSTHVFVSGQFMIHFYKMPNNRIRMKIIAIRSKGKGINGEVDLEDGVKLIGFKLLNNRIQDLIDLKPFRASIGKSKHDLFLIDYVFNLNDASAANAFEGLVKRKLRFKDIDASNPFAGHEKLRDIVISDIGAAEQLAHQDYSRKPADRRVQRIFKGSNSLESRAARIKIGINLAKYERGFNFGQNKVISTDMNEVDHRYLLDTYSHFSKSRMLFGFYGEENIANTSLLYAADTGFNPTRFVALMMARESKMRNFKEDDYQDIREHAREVLPARLYTQINWKNWSFKKGSLANGYFKEEVFFEPQAIAQIPMKDAGSIERSYAQYLIETGKPRAQPRFGIPLDPRRFGKNWLEIYRADLNVISLQLAVIFNPKSTHDQRYFSYNKLRSIPLYRETMAGYLMGLLPPNDLENLMTYKITLSAKGADTVFFEFGKFEDNNLYDSLLYIQNVVSNRSYDLRLLIGDEGEIKDNSMY